MAVSMKGISVIEAVSGDRTSFDPESPMAPTIGSTGVRRLVDLLLMPAGYLMPHERALLEAAVLQLDGDLQTDLKLRLADRLSQMEDAPTAMVRELSAGDIEIARILLERSTALCDSDLIHLVKTATPAHWRVIAGRRRLSSAVSDALIDCGEADTLRILLSNSDAHLSERGTAALVRISQRDEGLAQLLLVRNDLAPRFAHRMFWWLPAELRAYVLARYTADRTVLQRALGLTGGSEPEDGILWPREVRLLIGPVRQVEQRLITEFCDFYRADRERGLAKLVCDMTGIGRETAHQILRDEDGEAFALLCKAIGVPRQELLDLLSIARSADRTALRITAASEALIALYDSVSTDRADLALRYWDSDLDVDGQPVEGVAAAS